MIDFNNDALGLMADALRPLIGEAVTIDLAPEGYLSAKLIGVQHDSVTDDVYIAVQEFADGDFDGAIRYLHASQDCRRIRITR